MAVGASAPYSDASRVIRADSPTRSGGDRHALKIKGMKYYNNQILKQAYAFPTKVDLERLIIRAISDKLFP
jgi:hypothetical protein